MKALAQILLVLFVLNVTSYIVLRSRWSHRWEKDGKIYMEFPVSPGWVYYVFRPLCIGDEKLSGMHFHIGPHPGADTDSSTSSGSLTSPTPVPVQ